jgi:hypothetical protein
MAEEEAVRPTAVGVSVAKIVTAFVAALVGVGVTYALAIGSAGAATARRV